MSDKAKTAEERLRGASEWWSTSIIDIEPPSFARIFWARRRARNLGLSRCDG